MIATVDKDKCVGCGLCGDICPEVFEVKEGVAIVLVEKVPDSAQATCREATTGCPVEAIILKD